MKILDWKLSLCHTRIHSTDMIFLLPKVNLSHQIDFTKVLNDMGVKLLTDSQRADLSRLTSQNIYNSRIHFDTIIQKVQMSITEEGTEAAAVSAAFGFRMGGDDPIRSCTVRGRLVHCSAASSELYVYCTCSASGSRVQRQKEREREIEREVQERERERE
uniref:Serpin domain-containing protein n=1 Tax=Trichogramma kaykai TaxID=54128 RepID=A0ABD2XD74_9HYME